MISGIMEALFVSTARRPSGADDTGRRASLEILIDSTTRERRRAEPHIGELPWPRSLRGTGEDAGRARRADPGFPLNRGRWPSADSPSIKEERPRGAFNLPVDGARSPAISTPSWGAFDVWPEGMPIKDSPRGIRTQAAQTLQPIHHDTKASNCPGGV
jgi:hypothetical protein